MTTTTDLDTWDPNTPAPWETGDTGMDIKPEEMTMPRLKIIGKEAVFENSATGDKFEVLHNVVVLGMVRARSYWPKDRDEEQKQPLCRSYDDKLGIPEESDEVAKRFHFPWPESNFDRENLLAEGSTDDYGRIVLPCAQCKFSKWDEVRRKPAPCALQYNIPLFYDDENGNQQAAIFTAQKSSLTPFKRYLSAFEAAKKPAFMNYCEISLLAEKNGSVDYAVPQIRRGAPTDPGEQKSNHRYYYETLLNARRMLTTIRPPRGADDASDDSFGADSNENNAPEFARGGGAAAATKGGGVSRTVSTPPPADDIVDAEVEEEAPAPKPAAKKAAPKKAAPNHVVEPDPAPVEETPAEIIDTGDDDMDF